MGESEKAIELLANQFRLLDICRSLYETRLGDPYNVVGVELPIAGTTVTVTREMVGEAIDKAHRDHIAWRQDYESGEGMPTARQANRREGRNAVLTRTNEENE